LQKAYQASYPPGDSKEDWKIINELSQLLKRKKLYNNKDELVDSMINYLNLNKKKNIKDEVTTDFISEQIVVDPIDYYFSNVICRSSKTMLACRNEKSRLKKTGTEG